MHQLLSAPVCRPVLALSQHGKAILITDLALAICVPENIHKRELPKLGEMRLDKTVHATWTGLANGELQSLQRTPW